MNSERPHAESGSPRIDLLVGIDGGGTACRARVADAAGNVLGEGRAGPANTLLGIGRVLDAMRAAAARALESAGLDASELARLRAGAGLAGLTLDAERRAIRDAHHPFASLTVESDAYVACLGAHGGGDGAILVLGTGSCGCAIVDGRPTTVGGWGPRVSDHASGAALGAQALRQALLAHDGVIEASALSRALMARFDGSPDHIVRWVAEAIPAQIAALAPVVVEHAGHGDAIATDLMQWAARDAVMLIEALHRKGAERVVLVGGFSQALRAWLPGAATALLDEPRGDAMDGALLLARRAGALDGAPP